MHFKQALGEMPRKQGLVKVIVTNMAVCSDPVGREGSIPIQSLKTRGYQPVRK
jgi:hypothetical protein